MSDPSMLEEYAIALGDSPASDAFGLSVTINGVEALESLIASGPGIFRSRRNPGDPPFAEGLLLAKGDIAGFLQRGVLALPLVMPEDGWPLAAAPDGMRVEHGTPVVRYIRAVEAITP
jgi:hypothetical protein